MTGDIFSQLIEWRCEKSKTKILDGDISNIYLSSILQELNIMSDDEILLSKNVRIDWYQDSEQTYMTLGEINVENKYKTRTILIAAFAIITPPPINLEDRANSWYKIARQLDKAGVNIPRWFLIYNATIFTYYPPHNLLDYLYESDLGNFELAELADSLSSTLKGLANLSIMPLDLIYSLRTDSNRVYYCGLGFEVGGFTGKSKDLLIKDFENELIPQLPKKFKEKYLEITRNQ